MLERTIENIVTWCSRRRWLTVLFAALITASAVVYTAANFAINTDTGQLISAELPWRQRELAFDAAFPQQSDTILLVIDAETTEAADGAAERLASALQNDATHIKEVTRLGAGPFFAKNGLLYLSVDEVEATMGRLIQSQPVLATLAADPTLRGLAKVLGMIPVGVAQGSAKIEDQANALTLLSGAFEDAADGRRPRLSWSALMTGGTPDPHDLRRFLRVKPVLDFGAIEPGEEASAAIRETAAKLGLTNENGIRVRLTGSVAMADEEFSTIEDGALMNFSVSFVLLLVILWLALKSARIIVAVLITLVAGLALTGAAGLAMVGALNLISVAFAVLFVGIGIDFGIQFAVRYREERHKQNDLSTALSSAAHFAGKPLALAAAATSAGFFSFLPTAYRGVSELGLIAGVGMLIAFLTSITLLPALLAILKPASEQTEVGYPALRRVDLFMARNRWSILAIVMLTILAATPLLADLRFDFNPLNLRSAKGEAVATVLDLMHDPQTSPDTIDILAPSLDEARALGKKLEGLPEVDHTITLASFVPEDQGKKLALIRDAAGIIGATLSPDELAERPTGQETVDTLRDAASAFKGLDLKPEGRPIADRMAAALTRLADAPAANRAAAETALVATFQLRLAQLKSALEPATVTLASLPTDLARDWMTADGRARVEVAPKGNPRNNTEMQRFVAAVTGVAPEATGAPVLIQESANTVVHAFLQAAVLALVSITIILFVVLRRVSDVLVTLVPLLLASVVTLELCVLIDMPLNFANIIALPLLLGVGVAFKIYYVLAWRSGETYLLASPLTRAVMYSALTTAVAFGSLCFSHHPGTASMGKLLALALVSTLSAAVLFQPILMGPPRQSQKQ